MPSYVRRRLLSVREFAATELDLLRRIEPVFNLPVLDELRHFVDFHQYAFLGLDIDGNSTGQDVVLATDMGHEICDDYIGRCLYKIDPLTLAATRERPNVSWHDLSEDVTGTPHLAPLRNLLLRFQIRPRTIFTFWNENRQPTGAAIFTREKPFTTHERALLQWTSEKLHEDLSGPVLRAFNAQIGLNQTEQRCLELASRGMTSEKIARELGVHPESINSAFKLATRKIGARNRPHAVADAIRLGIIA